MFVVIQNKYLICKAYYLLPLHFFRYGYRFEIVVFICIRTINVAMYKINKSCIYSKETSVYFQMHGCIGTGVKNSVTY